RPVLVQFRDPPKQLLIDIWAFFCASAHNCCQLLVAGCQRRLPVLDNWQLSIGNTYYTVTVCGRCWNRPNFRRLRISFSLFFRGLRVIPPLAGTPVRLTGCLPPLLRPSPPPSG